jgi:uncharacterized membrane protein YkvA (DUF1232 family)
VDAETERRFVDAMRGWLISLPHDLKLLYEASTDENLERKERELAVGAIFYVLTPSDQTSASDFTGYADDCVMVRLALQRIVKGAGEDAAYLTGRFPEFFEALERELDACGPAMGELYAWLQSRVDHLPELLYKGTKVAKVLDDDAAAESLYESGLAFGTAYPVDEKRLFDKFKKASTILEVIARRKSDEDMKLARG